MVQIVAVRWRVAMSSENYRRRHWLASPIGGGHIDIVLCGNHHRIAAILPDADTNGGFSRTTHVPAGKMAAFRPAAVAGWLSAVREQHGMMCNNKT
jgi:hypothetical protein